MSNIAALGVGDRVLTRVSDRPADIVEVRISRDYSNMKIGATQTQYTASLQLPNLRMDGNTTVTIQCGAYELTKIEKE